jgi:hypothetical protein
MGRLLRNVAPATAVTLAAMVAAVACGFAGCRPQGQSYGICNAGLLGSAVAVDTRDDQFVVVSPIVNCDTTGVVTVSTLLTARLSGLHRGDGFHRPLRDERERVALSVKEPLPECRAPTCMCAATTGSRHCGSRHRLDTVVTRPTSSRVPPGEYVWGEAPRHPNDDGRRGQSLRRLVPRMVFAEQ